MESVGVSGRQSTLGQGSAFPELVEHWKARVFAKELHDAKLLSDEGWKGQHALRRILESSLQPLGALGIGQFRLLQPSHPLDLKELVGGDWRSLCGFRC